MAPSFFGSSSRDTSSSVKYFEIRLNESNLILRGTEYEASSVVLKGTLVLCLSEPIRVQGIRLRFTGERRLGWYQPTGSGASAIKYEEEFLRHTWDFQNSGKRSSETLPAGNYEYPFDLIIPGSTPESVEGMTDTWLVYRLKATIERGMLQQNSVSRKPVRIIRTLDTAALELAHAMSVENIWPEKVNYSLSTPTKAVIFGTTVQVDFRLIPLLKGLTIGKITTELNERQEMIIKGPRTPKKSRQTTRIIVKDEHHLPNDVEAEDINGQEGFVFSRTLALPQSLKKCLQSVDALGIRIRHNLNFNVQMHNPDGHVSELHATLPLSVFISPNMPIDDNNNLVNQGPQYMNASAALDDLTPPQYGEHQFDQLYSDIDPSGYMTPAGGASGRGTPFQSRSRSVSAENLASMDGVASSDFGASVLQSRLTNLDVVGFNRPVRDRSQLSTSGDGTEPSSLENAGVYDTGTPQDSLPRSGGYFGQIGGSASGQSTSISVPVSRRVSEEDEVTSGPMTPQHIEFSAESLAKVPSYTTALRTNPRTLVNDGLPTYQSATRPTQVPAMP